jgi:hypothetical protein
MISLRVIFFFILVLLQKPEELLDVVADLEEYLEEHLLIPRIHVDRFLDARPLRKRLFEPCHRG